MQGIINLDSCSVSIICPDQLGAGTEVFVIAANLVTALVGVELLLDQLELRQLWYQKEVIFEDGVFKATLEQNATHWLGWNSQERRALACKYGC